MPRIEPSLPFVTVIVTLDAEPEKIPDLQIHAEEGLKRFPHFPGFVGGALHLSADGGRLVQYLQWRSEEEYRACIEDPVWKSLPSTQGFQQAIEEGEARMDLRIFSVVRVSEVGGSS